MDRVIQKKKWSTKRILTIAGITGVIVLITLSYVYTSGKSRLNVDTERLTISEITKGNFKEFIPVNGVVMPLTTIYLDAMEGGRVEEKFVDDGTVMHRLVSRVDRRQWCLHEPKRTADPDRGRRSIHDQLADGVPRRSCRRC